MEAGGFGLPLKKFLGRKGAAEFPAGRLGRRTEAAPGERCEICGAEIPADHWHVVNVESRRLLCTCRPCYLLFTHEGAAQGKYRAVGERYLYDPSFELSAAQWEELQIPVGLAFFFFHSGLGRWVAFYPSPGGATESLLELGAWVEVLRANPAFDRVSPDVGAVLVRRVGEGFEAYLVPIDACYGLVGRVRRSWRGFGGDQVWAEIDGFLEQLRARSRWVRPGGAHG